MVCAIHGFLCTIADQLQAICESPREFRAASLLCLLSSSKSRVDFGIPDSKGDLPCCKKFSGKAERDIDTSVSWNHTSHFGFTGKLGEDYPGKIRLRPGIPDNTGRAWMRDLAASYEKAQIAVRSLFKAYPLLRCCHPSDGKTYRLLHSSASS